MIEALKPLAETPGVRFAALVTPDGVPIAVPGRAEREMQHAADEVESGVPAADDLRPELGPPTEIDAMAALSVGWLNEITTAIAPLSWEAPARVVIRAARGTLVMKHALGSWLLVLLASGLRAEDVMLSMEGTAARIERIVRGMGKGGPASHGDSSNDPPGALPASRGGTSTAGTDETSQLQGEHQHPKRR